MIQCLKCGTANEPGSGFCSKCGEVLAGGQQVSPGNKKNLKIVFIIIGAVILLCVGCGIVGLLNERNYRGPTNVSNRTVVSSQTPTPEPAKPVVNMPAIANKTPEEVEKIVGKHIRIVPITSYPDQMPGEYRNYDLPEMKDSLTVRFYKGKAVFITFNVPDDKQPDTAEELAKMSGFDVSGKSADHPIPATSIWSGKFGDAEFVKVTTTKGNTSTYFVLNAEVRK